jgi:Ribosomal protein L32
MKHSKLHQSILQVHLWQFLFSWRAGSIAGDHCAALLLAAAICLNHQAKATAAYLYYEITGSNKKTRNVLPSGFYKFLVHNVKELELLLMHNRSVVNLNE